MAIDFDAVRKKWFPDDPVGRGNSPCSVDALTFERKGAYLIEFKNGGNDNLMRKVYDSALMLIEKDNQKVSDIRTKYYYIIVSSEIDSCKEKHVLTRARAYQNASPPTSAQKYHMTVLKDYQRKYNGEWGLSCLKDVVVSDIYPMPPDLFDWFVKAERWI